MLLGAGIALGSAFPAAALDCEPHPISSCIDSNQQWLANDSGPFLVLPSSSVLEAGKLWLGLTGVYQHRPLLLVAPAPAIEGRILALVENVVDSQLSLAGGLGHDLELDVTLRTVPYQDGVGAKAARSRNATGLERRAVRDPLVGVGYQLYRDAERPPRYGLKLRAAMSLPLGDAAEYAGEANVSVAPSAVTDLALGPVTLAAQLGVRLRRSVELGGFRYGSQLTSALGVALDVIPESLVLAGELTLNPGLVPQPEPEGGERALWIPAEWLLSVSTRWSTLYTITLGGGAGLPLSSQSTDFGSGDGREHFAGLGAPEVRLMLRFSVSSARTPN